MGKNAEYFKGFFYNKTCFIVKLNCKDKIKPSAKQVIISYRPIDMSFNFYN